MLHALIEGDPDAPFVAIDFETADYGLNDRCDDNAAENSRGS